jgi:pectin methylesterase-like acyl-CoA thioesterase
MIAKSILLRRSAACALFAVLAGSGQAQQLAASTSNTPQGAGGVESVVVTGTAFDPETAPAKSSLDATQPQTIINKSYIEGDLDFIFGEASAPFPL